jgi:ADP-ribose pyrophosphatase YjhB (NUDIX family)
MAATEIQIHQAQAKILRTLLFKTEARFRDLNTDKLGTDHFTFHLKQLIDQGILEKVGPKYCLTAKGKEFANRFDTEKVAVERQAKLTIMIIAVKNGKSIKYLSQQRLKQPFFGYRCWITGKIRWGEQLLQAAARELEEETGLKGKIEFVGIEHKTDYHHQTNEMLEDKFFYIVKATQTKGKLLENSPGCCNAWLSEKEIISDPKVFEDVPKILKNLKKNKFFFMEDQYKYTPQQYLSI